ncbi:MAG: hypothetical protein DHS20C14_06420 [Phycisphaeraceae bacterium]|nr:MAG: hypothetical protein DHS20C14_06420 [Phycisphaeraceae bacterium]
MQAGTTDRSFSRRGFLGVAAVGAAGAAGAIPARRLLARQPEAPVTGALPDGFPSQDYESVRAAVGASHGNMPRITEFVEARPALAKAAVDWGFGDWETAIGAASHVGNREIAEFLMSHGARPDIFTCAMMGWVDSVRAMVEARPGIQRLYGPHGFTLMHHARAGREEAESVRDYLAALGDADTPYASVPLDDAAREVYVGVYTFGPGAEERFEVENDRGSVWIKRPGNFGRRLVSLGDHAFHPIGAEAVRVVFGVDGGAARTLTVHDPGPVVTASLIAG